MLRKWIVYVPSALFLVVGIATIGDYGINWDNPLHFNRGQAYLRYLLTGQEDYNDLPKQQKPAGGTDFANIFEEPDEYGPDIKRVSYFQSDYFDFDYFVENDGGHPPANDILAALSNYVFFQKLSVVGDIESHHLFILFTSFLLVLGVGLFVFRELGIFPSLVASTSLATYPLFFAESHFNIKDPPVASFMGLAIIFFFWGVTRKKSHQVLASSVFAGLGLGTKFNTLFLVPILGIWFLVYLSHNSVNVRKNRRLLISLLAYPFIAGLVFYLFWPFLWQRPITGLFEVLGYYRDIGTGVLPELDRFLTVANINTFPSLWTVMTTPLSVLILAVVGLVVSFFLVKRKGHFSLLVLLWFFVPLVRVSVGQASIYGGVRQIMEFVPAMAILAGIGVWGIKRSIKWKYVNLAVFFALAYAIYELVVIHPNQNVYFNQITGGLSGARERQIPYWGNSYGNAYQQGVEWLNANAQRDARLALAVTNMVNVPRTRLRGDIDFSNTYWSGPNNRGEYVMELHYDWPPAQWYQYDYYNTFLEPVYETKVDGVAILKIWKNSKEHIIEPLSKETFYPPVSALAEQGRILTVDMGRSIRLTKLVVNHSTGDCRNQMSGFVQISADGETWKRMSEPIDRPQIPARISGAGDGVFVYMFAAKEARYIQVHSEATNSCLFNEFSVSVKGIEE